MVLSLGMVGSAHKPSERRVPLHPLQFERIPDELRSNIWVEEGYGEPFGIPDSELAPHVAGLLPRDDLFAKDIVLLPKPVEEDTRHFRDGLVLWGWPHCVQTDWMTQAGIDRKMTMIAWEAMNKWSNDGQWQGHTFQKNNEIAGYAAVLHALSLQGRTGHFGRPGRAAVIGFGSTGRGAIYALQALGYNDVAVFTQRHPVGVNSQLPGVRHHRFQGEGNDLRAESLDGEEAPFHEALGQFDIIVNCTFQDTDAPLMYVEGDQIDALARGTLIIDVSCDEGMGFEFAKPTTFADPMFTHKQVSYYAVDHTPSYLHDAASWEIGQALLPYLPTVMGGPEAWKDSATIQKAIEIQDGVIQNPKILSFQGRAAEYPHPRA